MSEMIDNIKKQIRVLMLEDTDTDAELAEYELRKAGIDFVTHRADRREGVIEALETFHPDVVLSDYHLPDFSGREALEIVQRNYPDVPVIMVTGALPDIEAVELIHAGAKDYVLKDRRARLVPAIQRALASVEEVKARKQAEKSLLRLNLTLRALSAGNHALVHAKDEQELLQDMCRAVTETGFALAWVGYAMRDEKKSVVPMSMSGKGVGFVEGLDISWGDTPQGQDTTGMAVRHGATQICHDIQADAHMLPWREVAEKYGFASSIALPLKIDGTVIGALTLYAAEAHVFDAAQVQLLEEMADDLAFGIANLRMRQELDEAIQQRQRYADELRASMEDALQAISATLEARDPYTAGHQRRVARLARAIAEELGLESEQMHGIHLAGIVHDIGKIHVPAEILSKPGRLNDFEYGLIKLHPQSGHEILKGISFPWPIAQAVLQHHERLNGSGYPQGLSGDNILLEARILAVADVIDAMASHRPYREGLGLEAALHELRSNSGILFDAEVVAACIRLVSEKNFDIEKPLVGGR